ncbi:hypothetical protein KIW84_033232 [Lathyrus oleraceus]|uniref:PB1-like domain-containing protein n=1 Tax=Pisum sativum TaxID=3888 RepID=A0A9D4XWC0_PEA|nr:hypothetical protein KIW84_033232 [Pisum sativum]
MDISIEVKLCLRPSQNHKVKLRIHHKDRLVVEPVKWYVDGYVSEMNWKWDVELMSYMDLKSLIKSEGYKGIRCMWYWNSRFNFSCDLRLLNNDNDALQFAKDVIGFEVMDVYVEHNVEILETVDDSELGTNIDDDKVQCTGFKNVAEERNDDDHVDDGKNVAEEMTSDGHVNDGKNVAEERRGDDHVDDGKNVAEEMSVDGNVDDGENVEVDAEKGVGHVDATQNVEVDDEISVDEDYVASDDNVKDNYIPFSDDSKETNLTKVFPSETLGEVFSANNEQVPTDMRHEESKDYDNLYTPPKTNDDE